MTGVDVTFAVVCDYANITGDGKLNVLGVFGEINPPVLPFSFPQMFLVVSYKAQPPEYESSKQIKMVLLDSDATSELLSLEQTVVIPRPVRPGTPVRFNHVIGMAGVGFPKAGDYVFHVMVNDDSKASVEIHVNEPPEAQNLTEASTT